ncbi:MAG: hypothetical protein J7K87_01365 [Candidatus Aenigmarchaeota archaeon]|nr:hypothetical protein [Candidatus Aenigmarchaeota archaeon]
MHLLEYLLKNYVKSKETARYLIDNELVKVNNCIATYPELPIGKNDVIEIMDTRFLDVPGSFWKLKEIQESSKIIKKGDFVLDIGSPDGGFPLFAKECGAEVTALAMDDSLGYLSEKGIRIEKFNIMKINPREIFKNKFDLIINEIRLDIMKSIQIFEKFIPLIESRGKVLMFLSRRERNDDEVKEIIENVLGRERFRVVDFFKERRGTYAYLKRI